MMYYNQTIVLMSNDFITLRHRILTNVQKILYPPITNCQLRLITANIHNINWLPFFYTPCILFIWNYNTLKNTSKYIICICY